MAWTSCFANLPNAWLRTTSLPSGPGLPGTGALIIRIVGSSPGIETPIGPVPVAVPGRQEVPVPVAVHLDGPRASQALGIVAAVILVDHHRTPPAVVVPPVAVVVGVVGVEIDPAAVVVPRPIFHPGIVGHAARQQHQTTQQSENSPGSIHDLLAHQLIDYRKGRSTPMERLRHSCREWRSAYLVAGLYEAIFEGKPDVLVRGHAMSPRADVTPSEARGRNPTHASAPSGLRPSG